MKRHQVMDLFFGDMTETIDEEWKTGIPDTDRCKVKVKLSNGNEKFAYFYADKARINAMIGESAHFWHSQTHEPLYNVTHYKMLKND